MSISDLMAEVRKTTDGLLHSNIANACLLIALDNGGINRGRGDRKWRSDYTKWIAKQEAPTLVQMDAWFGGLSPDDLDTVCSGEVSEADAILVTSPAFTSDLLNAYFDEVC